MLERTRQSRSGLLSHRLALASVCTAVAIGVVCAVAVSSLGDAARAARSSLDRQISIIDDAMGMRAFFDQKTFVSNYILTGDRKWLAEPDVTHPTFEAWLSRANAAVES